VAVVDLCVGDESGLDISRSLLSARPNLRILLMSGAGRVTPAVARAAGAYGFVAKDWTAGAMVEAVWLAASGRHVFAREDDDRVAAQALTARERDVLLHLARGLSNPEVASELNLSRHTVKQHTSSVYKKLGVRNRAEAASRAQRLGLVA
jgi:DNA-binding NarL/FixJ family response regulator